jgi:hypothetical protein
MLKLRPHLLAVLIAPAVLTACGSRTPNEADFLQNATQLLASQTSPMSTTTKDICLLLNFSGDVSSGELSDGWVAYANEAPAASAGNSSYVGRISGGRQEALRKLTALEAVGVIEKQPYELYQGGALKPGYRYQLTQSGRDAVVKTTSLSPCLSVGHWEPKAVVAPRSAVESKTSKLIVQKDVGDTPSFEAWVSYELKGRPSWSANPQLEAAFPQELTPTKSGKLQKLELVKFNDKWVSKELLARQMSRDGAMGDRGFGAGAPILPIPKDLESTALAKLSESLTRGYNRVASIPLPQRASETPTSYANSHPGHFFFAATPDPQAASRSDVADKIARLGQNESYINSLPEAQRVAQLARLETERRWLAAAVPAQVSVSEQDRYLNQRKQLQELLDSLVTAGAYEKRTVAGGELPGASVPGVLYTPVAGVDVTSRGITLGTITVNGPLKQEVMNPRMLQLTATYAYANPPQWAETLAKTNPSVARQLKGGVVRAVALAQENAEFPYRIDASHLN